MGDRRQPSAPPSDQRRPAPPPELMTVAVRELERRAFMAGLYVQPWVTTENGTEQRCYVFDDGDSDRRKFYSVEGAFNEYLRRSGVDVQQQP